MSQKPSIPKGTRDFLPNDVVKRNFIFSTISSAFKRYGFQAIETPSFELSSTLMGKYGDEGDRLIFRILNSGEKVKKADLTALQEDNLGRFANSLSEKALRYDLTVPFARFVVQHQNDLSFPFKRFQIQPVWRADRPQHGRYQEFYQCDGDIVGSDSLRNEVELIFIIDEVLDALNIPGFTIKLNNRKILAGIAEVAGIKDQLIAFTVALDKLDKIGQEGVEKELLEKGISAEVITQIQPLFLLTGDFSQRLAVLAEFLRNSEVGIKGIQELTFINEKVSKIGLKKGLLELDVTLARGLNYYTGAIIEVKAHEVSMGSICGGGRYDNLTELFGLSGVSGVGISFGADRIYDIMESLSLFPNQLSSAPDILFLNFSEEEADQCALWANELRSLGKLVELYPSNAKLQKQMKYANDKGINWVVFYGDQERKEGKVVVKNMLTGDQTSYQATSWLSAWLG